MQTSPQNSPGEKKYPEASQELRDKMETSGQVYQVRDAVSAVVYLLMNLTLEDKELGQVAIEESIASLREVESKADYERETLEEAKKNLGELIAKLNTSRRKKVGIVSYYNDDRFESGTAMVKKKGDNTNEIHDLRGEKIDVYNNDLIPLRWSREHDDYGDKLMLGTTELTSVVIHGSGSDSHLMGALVSHYTLEEYLKFLESKVSDGLINDRRKELSSLAGEK